MSRSRLYRIGMVKFGNQEVWNTIEGCKTIDNESGEGIILVDYE